MIRDLVQKLGQNPRTASLMQFVKFGIVGMSNTAISYAIEILCYYVLFVQTEFSVFRRLCSILGIEFSVETARILFTSILAFVVSVTNSYYWNNKHVFGSKEKKSIMQHISTYLKTAACYALTGLFLAPWAKTWLGEQGIPYWFSTLLVLIVTIPLNFVMNKLWAFRKTKEQM